MQNFFISISSILPLITTIIYTHAIVKGDAKPHRTTRLILLIISALATVSLLAQHNTVAIWLSGVSTIQCIVIFILSLKRGMGGYAKTDIVCLTIALFGIVLWQVTKTPVVALYFAILADFMGMVPSLIKTYRFPHTEVYLPFLLDFFAALFSFLAVKNRTIPEVSYPLYLVFINLAMTLLILRPLFHSSSQKV